MKTDHIFYQLFQTMPGLLFELIGQPTSTALDYIFDAKEIKELSFRFDGIFVPTNNLELPIYFVEVQFYDDKKFYADFFAEIHVFLQQYSPEHNWRAIAIFSDRDVDPGFSVHYEEYFTSGRLRRVHLDEVRELPSSSIGFSLAKLLVEPDATAVEKSQQLIAQARAGTTPHAEKRKLLELIDKILVYKFNTLSRKELETMFGLGDLRQTRYFQDVASESELEGSRKMARENILQVLSVRFKQVPIEVTEMLNSIGDVTVLKELLKQAVSVKKMTDFQRALKKAAKN